MIPLIDVMLVLLVIFIITAPLLTHAVKIDLPKASSTPNLTKPDNIQLASTRAGTRVLERRDRATRPDWRSACDDRRAGEPQPEVHLRADRTTQYQAIAEVHGRRRARGLTAHRLRVRSARGPVIPNSDAAGHRTRLDRRATLSPVSHAIQPIGSQPANLVTDHTGESR